MLLSPTQVPAGTEPGQLPAHEGYKPSRSLGTPAAPRSPALRGTGELIRLSLGALLRGAELSSS